MDLPFFKTWLTFYSNKRPGMFENLNSHVFEHCGCTIQYRRMIILFFAFFSCILRHCYGKYVQIIGLKAPGSYSDQFGSNKVSVLLCEGPESPNS